MHGLVPVERQAIVRVHEHWDGIDSRTRKPAYRGSRLDVVQVSGTAPWSWCRSSPSS